jgi:hypothetical protein
MYIDKLDGRIDRSFYVLPAPDSGAAGRSIL